MKLSAPPPPPSDPTGDATPKTPDEATNSTTPGTNSPELPPPPPATPKLATWPAWYSGVDSMIVALVLAFAFLAASFVARNSDVWLHLATGKRLFAGEYFPGGSDPFSYSAEGRTWVNHSWLTDATAYLLYGGSGKLLVLVKAILITLTFALLIGIRRPKFSLWPWAACAAVGVLAAAPQFPLRPIVVSLFLFAVTLFLTLRMKHKRDSWRYPIAIGITFWIWANSDQWFFVGPLAIALLLIGDLIQRYGFNSPEDPDETPETESLSRLPHTKTLARALGIGLVACLLNPHHVRVWQLPFELTGIAGAENDQRLQQQLFSPVTNLYLTNAGLGANANGVAFGLLFIGGAVIFGLGVGRVRLAHILLWLGFALLSLASIFTVPFFVMVAVPLVASQLNAFSSRITLSRWSDPRTRAVLLGSSLGRVVSIFALCLACFLAYPGWVHPEPSNAAYARRVAWGVEPDAVSVNAAEQFRKWRENDMLAADARGVILQPDLANYMAWFAPKEKVHLNTRFSHHRQELAEYLTMRKGLGLNRVKDETPNIQDTTEVLKKLKAEYVAIHSQSSTREILVSQAVTGLLYQVWGEWSAWYQDGRTTVFGWRANSSEGRPSFAALRLDPTRLAFGTGASKVPDGEMKQPLIPGGWEEAYVRPAKIAPPGSSEAIGWLNYKDGLVNRQRIRQTLSGAFFFYGAPTGNSMHHFSMISLDSRGALRFPPKHEDSEADVAAMRAIPILAMQAARRAIVADPDHPDGYYALGRSLGDTDLPLTESERAIGMVTAYRQALSRFPAPDKYKRGQFGVAATDVALELTRIYLGRRLEYRDPQSKKPVVFYTGFPVAINEMSEVVGQTILETRQGTLERVPTIAIRGKPLSQDVRPYANGIPFVLPLDQAREVLQLALQYAPIDLARESSDAQQAMIKQLEAQLAEVQDALVRSKRLYDTARANTTKLPELVQRAIFTNMISEALKQLTVDNAVIAKEYGENVAVSVIQRITLELVLGNVENANELLNSLSQPEQAAKLQNSGIAVVVQRLKFYKALFAGEFGLAGELWDSMAPPVGRFDKLPPLGPGLPEELVLAAIQAVAPGKDPKKAIANFLTPPLVFTPGHAQLTQYRLWMGPWYSMATGLQQAISDQLTNEIEFYHRRGVLFLLQGDVPAAQERFRLCARTAPQGWGVPEHRHPGADMYLDLMKRASEKKPAAP